MKDGAKVGSAVGWRGKGRQKDGAMWSVVSKQTNMLLRIYVKTKHKIGEK